jgi:hypothetical protein
MDLFKLCKRKKLKPEEKQKILDNPTILNNIGENLFHNLLKHDNCDIELYNQMLILGHDLYNTNKMGYTSFYSCIEHCKNEKRHDKLCWILGHDNQKMLHTKSFEPTHYMLFYFTYERWYLGFDDKHFRIIQKLHELNLLEKNLTTNKYEKINMDEICVTLEQLLWFEQNFNYLTNKSYYYGNTIFHCLEKSKDLELIEYLFKKYPNSVNTPDLNMEIKLLEQLFVKYKLNDTYENQIAKIGLLYKYGFDNNDGQAWRDLFDLNFDMNSQFDRNILVWILNNKKMKWFNWTLIKRYQLTLDDFLFPDKFGKLVVSVGCDPTDGTIYSTSVIEGYKYNAEKVLSLYTKEYCEKLHDQIMEIINK